MYGRTPTRTPTVTPAHHARQPKPNRAAQSHPAVQRRTVRLFAVVPATTLLRIFEDTEQIADVVAKIGPPLTNR